MQNIGEALGITNTEDAEAESDLPSDVTLPSSNAIQLVDLESWLIQPTGAHSIDVAEQELIGITESDDPTSDGCEPSCTHPSQSACVPITRQASAAMLHTLPAGDRSPDIQIGFNFAEGEP